MLGVFFFVHFTLCILTQEMYEVGRRSVGSLHFVFLLIKFSGITGAPYAFVIFDVSDKVRFFIRKVDCMEIIFGIQRYHDGTQKG